MTIRKTDTVLILGASGKIGRRSTEAFWNAGWRVRLWDRKREDLTRAAKGADVIVNGLNPPGYHDWPRLIPQITGQVIDAAQATGATVVLPGNVYNYGAVGGVWDETTPHNPNSRKGRLRVEMEAAYRKSGVRTILLRAGNFIDPAASDTLMGAAVTKNLGRGRIVALGRPDIPQAWAYVPDWARAAAMLARRREVLARFEEVTFPGNSFSILELQAALELETGLPLRLGRFPWWALRLASPVWEFGREFLEMRYLNDTPHRLSGEKFDRLLPDFRPTREREVIRATMPPEMRAPGTRQMSRMTRGGTRPGPVARSVASDVDPDEAMRPCGQAVLP